MPPSLRPSLSSPRGWGLLLISLACSTGAALGQEKPQEKPEEKSKPAAKPKAKAAPKKKPAPPPKPPETVAILNARVMGSRRPVGILISDGKITSIQPGMRLPSVRGIRRIDAEGGLVVPGRIDAWAAYGNPYPLGNALDEFDPYNTHMVEDALRNGVTSVFLAPRRSAGICGLGAVIKLKPGSPISDAVVNKEAAVCAGLMDNSPIRRIAQFEMLRKTFRSARAYQKAWEEYEEALEEYIKKLPKAKPKAKGKPSAKKDGTGKSRAKKPVPQRRVVVRRPMPVRRPVPAKPGSKTPPAKEDAKKKGPTKPKEPRINRAQALLVRVLERELPLRLEAHWSSDLLNALDLQEEFGLRMILDGASEAHLLADELVRREVPVVLGSTLHTLTVGGSYPMRRQSDLAAVLSRAGVEFAVGSGSWLSTRSLEFNAKLAAGAGLSAAEAEAAITTGAAKLLGVGDRLGRIKAGYDADLVILEGGDLGSERPRMVLVDGKVVYRRQP